MCESLEISSLGVRFCFNTLNTPRRTTFITSTSHLRVETYSNSSYGSDKGNTKVHVPLLQIFMGQPSFTVQQEAKCCFFI